MDIKQKIESILFFKGQPVSYKELSKILETEESQIQTLIKELSTEHTEKGTQIVFNDHEAELTTSTESSELISSFQKQETETELSNATLETLSIVMYMGPITRSMIDYIRGVNSQFTVRNLLVRGLIEKDPKSKSTQYVVTLDTIKFLGLNSINELPNYTDVKHQIAQFIKDNSNETNQ